VGVKNHLYGSDVVSARSDLIPNKELRLAEILELNRGPCKNIVEDVLVRQECGLWTRPFARMHWAPR
jgi:hypothetical protein